MLRLRDSSQSGRPSKVSQHKNALKTEIISNNTNTVYKYEQWIIWLDRLVTSECIEQDTTGFERFLNRMNVDEEDVGEDSYEESDFFSDESELSEDEEESLSAAIFLYAISNSLSEDCWRSETVFLISSGSMFSLSCSLSLT